MSSVLIKGMEMPQSCAKCMCGQNGLWCYTTDRDFCDDFGDVKLDDCPLVEVKEPHGRLIDADKLMMSLADWWYSSFGQEETDEAKAIRAVMQQVEKSIDEMTVIEAEGSEE